MKQVTVRRSRYTLFGIWIGAFMVIGAVLFIQQVAGVYGADSEAVWSWFIPNILPTVSLMAATLVSAQDRPETDTKLVDRQYFRLTLIVSVFYVALLFGTVMAQPFTGIEPLELMSDSSLYLAPFQGIATGLIGVFLLKKPAPPPDDPGEAAAAPIAPAPAGS